MDLCGEVRMDLYGELCAELCGGPECVDLCGEVRVDLCGELCGELILSQIRWVMCLRLDCLDDSNTNVKRNILKTRQ